MVKSGDVFICVGTRLSFGVELRTCRWTNSTSELRATKVNEAGLLDLSASGRVSASCPAENCPVLQLDTSRAHVCNPRLFQVANLTD